MQPAADVGIRGLYVYFPRLMVQQQDLEAADGCAGKYTVGLGQQQMAFCGDREDVVSMAATAVLRLLETSGVTPADIGRIEVGTETGVDRSKSVMSYLLQYFNEAGNYTVQGSDHMHGCYGGTSALFTVTDWVCSPSWDGRLGLVVATDIAVYPPGSPARPTGGCGAAAMLVGPDAPVVVEPWPWRASFSAHTFDFFKPHGHPLYPVVDGPATLLWFTKAADACAAKLYEQLQQHGLLGEQQHGSRSSEGACAARSTASQVCGCHQPQQQQQQQQQPEQQLLSGPGLLSLYDYFLSHAPYNKLVRKVFARLVLHDALRTQAHCGGPASHTEQQQQQPTCCEHAQQNECQQQQPLDDRLQQCLELGTATSSAASRQQQQQDGSSAAATVAAGTRKPALPPLPPEAAGLDLSAPLPDSTIQDKGLERALLASSGPLYQHMGSEASALQRQLGNLYTASLYSGLASLLSQQGTALAGKRLLCFSFGSGVVSCMFTLTCRATTHSGSSSGSGGNLQSGNGAAIGGAQQQTRKGWQSAPCSLESIADQLDLPRRLASRLPRSVDDFDAAMSSLRAAYNTVPYTPSFGSLDDLEPGTVFLSAIDAKFRRTYSRRQL